MSWTSTTILEKHLLGFAVDGLTVPRQEVDLKGVAEAQLPHQNLLEGSVTLAMLLASTPVGPVSLTLTGTSWYPVGVGNLLRDSVVVGFDDAPTLRYTEGGDYAVDHEAGKIKRLSGSSIVSGATVKVWYLPMTVYTEDTDFHVNYAEGKVMRAVLSTIPDPARVMVSYTTNAAAGTSSLLLEAITEAEDKITARLREGYTAASDDQGLVTGATELALSIVLDALAIQTLSGTDAGADDRAKRFMELAQRFQDKATATLARFLTQPLQAELVRKQNPAKATGW